MRRLTRWKSVNKVLYVSGYSRMVLFNKIIPKAIREAGFNVFEFDWNSFFSFNRYLKLFPRDFLEKRINEQLLKVAANYKPDYVFVLKGEPIYTETLKQIKKKFNPVLFNWFWDVPWEFPYFSGKVAPFYDYFFTYDPFSVNLYKDSGYKNAFHIPYGYDYELTESVIPTDGEFKKYKCDVAFIGSYYPEREKLLYSLKHKYDIKIWGRGWKNTSCSDVYRGKALYGTEMIKAMKSCKIILNIHRGFTEGVSASGEGLNLRVMEAAACSAFQLTSFQKDIPKRFEPNKEIVLFKNWEEALGKLDYYLKLDAERQRVAQAAFERLKKEHTLKNRIEEMFEIIAKDGIDEQRK